MPAVTGCTAVTFRLDGKAALITGASRGIGAAIARRFAEEGADLAITYLHSAEAAEEVAAQARLAGVRAMAICCDAGDCKATRDMVHAVHAQLGRLDILVNNAGRFDGKPLPETADDDFDRSMAVNVRGPYIAGREAAKLMTDGGRIINIASSFGLRVPAPGLGLYAISKYAVIGLTHAFARDLGSRGITVNAIAPGPIDTDMNREEGRAGKIMRMMTALGRYGTPEDVAALAAFLASDEAAYITGTVFSVDGGFNA